MPGKSKKGGGLEVGSAYKMKYQGGHSAFPFKSPMKNQKTKIMTKIEPIDLGKLQKPAEGFKWVYIDGKPTQVKIQGNTLNQVINQK